jgi:hypothetical protein
LCLEKRIYHLEAFSTEDKNQFITRLKEVLTEDKERKREKQRQEYIKKLKFAMERGFITKEDFEERKKEDNFESKIMFSQFVDKRNSILFRISSGNSIKDLIKNINPETKNENEKENIKIEDGKENIDKDEQLRRNKKSKELPPVPPKKKKNVIKIKNKIIENVDQIDDMSNDDNNDFEMNSVTNDIIKSMFHKSDSEEEEEEEEVIEKKVIKIEKKNKKNLPPPPKTEDEEIENQKKLETR